jgi:hypothetical protein
MNISSVGSSDSNVPIYFARSRASAPQSNSSENLRDTGRTSSIGPSNSGLVDKLDGMTRVQQALISAMRTGEAIESQGLLSVIE